MLHRILPLELSLEFDERAYTLGETIDALVEMQPSANIQVRSGRLDLVCEEHYTQRGVSSYRTSMRPTGSSPDRPDTWQRTERSDSYTVPSSSWRRAASPAAQLQAGGHASLWGPSHRPTSRNP